MYCHTILTQRDNLGHVLVQAEFYHRVSTPMGFQVLLIHKGNQAWEKVVSSAALLQLGFAEAQRSCCSPKCLWARPSR